MCRSDRLTGDSLLASQPLDVVIDSDDDDELLTELTLMLQADDELPEQENSSEVSVLVEMVILVGVSWSSDSSPDSELAPLLLAQLSMPSSLELRLGTFCVIVFLAVAALRFV